MTYWNALTHAPMILVAYLLLFSIAAGAAEPFAEIETLINGGHYEQALQKLDALLQQNPDDAEAQAQKGMVLGALADQAENMIEMARYGWAAMEAFETALKLDPDNITARLGRGTSSLMAPPPFDNVDAALADLQKVVELDADHAEAHYFLGVAHQKNGDVAQAKAAFYRALELTPDYEEAKAALAEFGVADTPPAQTPRRLSTAPLAFTRVTVIDVTGGPSKSDMTVVIEGRRIQALGPTGSTAIPTGAEVINASGQFLLPGLWDMHVHILGDPTWFFPLFIANGVTGVRYMGGTVLPEQWHVLRKRIASGDLLGTRVLAAGPILDGPEPVWPSSIALSTADEARAAVADLKRRGADFIKVYSLLSREVYFAIADEAKKQSIPFDGHVPLAVGSIAAAAAAGQRAIEHIEHALIGSSTREAEFMRTAQDGVGKGIKLSHWQELMDSYSAEKAAVLYATFVDNGTWYVPTLSVFSLFRMADAPTDEAEAKRKYLPPLILDFFADQYKSAGGFEPPDEALRRELMQRILGYVGELRQAGIPLLAGTDAPISHVYPGFTLHDELALFVEAGLTPLEALQTATLNPAKFSGQVDSLGTVEAGKIADLLLLEANPLEDIRNTAKIAGVVVGGRFLPEESLQAMLAELEEQIAAIDGD